MNCPQRILAEPLPERRRLTTNERRARNLSALDEILRRSRDEAVLREAVDLIAREVILEPTVQPGGIW